MMKFISSLMSLALPFSLVAAQGAVQLQYLTDQPVLQTSSVRIEISQPGRNGAASTAQQQVTAKLEIDGQGKSRPVGQLPLAMTLDLENVQVGAEAEGHSIAFDSDKPESSRMMAELAKVLGQPMNVTIGEDLQVTTDSKDFVKLLQKLENLEGFRVSNLVSEMFEHLFALAGHELRVGQEYTQDLALGGDQNIAVALTYKVVAITDSEIRATISGGFNSAEIEGRVPIGQKSVGEPQSLVLSGHIEGKAVWSRKNALLYKTRLNYAYDGVIKDNGKEIPIRIQVHHEDATKAI